jgi:hypothetical protein
MNGTAARLISELTTTWYGEGKPCPPYSLGQLIPR